MELASFSAFDSGYTLEVVTQPPSAGNPSRPFNTVRVQLHHSQTQADNGDDVDHTQLWVIASLVSGNEPDSALGTADALLGIKSASIKPTSSDLGCVGYADFHGLAISRGGTFQLRMALVDFGTPVNGDATDGAQILAMVDSHPVSIE
jgi:hypothetical protein